MAPKKAQSINRIVLPELSEAESSKLDAVCRRLLVKAGGKADQAAILGVEMAHYSPVFFNRMIAIHGTDGKVVALKYYDNPTVLEMLARAGVDLRFNEDELLGKAVNNGEWKAADYLIHFTGCSPAVEKYFRKAIELRNRDLFAVLFSKLLHESHTELWDVVGAELVKAEAWQILTDIWRADKIRFRRILATTDLLKTAMKAGANYLSFVSIKVLAAEHIFPELTEEESLPNKGLNVFLIKQMQAIHGAHMKQVQAEEEEELATPLKPAALSAFGKSEF